jgi:hypothetical protein
MQFDGVNSGSETSWLLPQGCHRSNQELPGKQKYQEKGQ